ncbi:3-oxoacyl-[acyl-carrier-protein] reductase [soil metagenome]
MQFLVEMTLHLSATVEWVEIDMNGPLNGKVALVTGGNRGIGAAITLALADAGAHVAIACRNGESALEIITANPTLSISHVAFDASDESSAGVCVKQTVETHGGIDILVNNAGITLDGFAMRQSAGDWDNVMNTNARGAFLLCGAAFSTLRKREGCIISISSVVGMYGNLGQVAYAASKAAITALTLSMAKESKGKIRAIIVAPGLIETDMTDAMPEAAKTAAIGRITLGRAGKASEVAALVRFLVTDGAYINGTTITIDGGMV